MFHTVDGHVNCRLAEFANRPAGAGAALAALMLGLAGAAALLAGWTPLLFSIATVFLFAGPHNWLEARYFLTRLPARWGKLRAFFLVAFAGLFLLTATFATLPWLGRTFATSADFWHSAARRLELGGSCLGGHSDSDAQPAKPAA